MSIAAFEALNSELRSLKQILTDYPAKTIRDQELLDRLRAVYRSWASAVKPGLEALLLTKRDFYKLEAELERIAQLTSKFKPVRDYQRRLSNAISLATGLVLYLPPSEGPSHTGVHGAGKNPFLQGIPDLPLHLVPNAIIGWKNHIESFLSDHPFDKSVFLMIRYLDRNKQLISDIKAELSRSGYYGVLASDHSLTDDLYNPVACLLACSKGIAIFDQPLTKQEFNPNVAYELGMMSLLGRQCLILKHESLQSLHTDILMKLYESYKRPSDAATKTEKWLTNLSQEE